jgi:ribosomal protein S18 acetylase RimI-like enzyme
MPPAAGAAAAAADVGGAPAAPPAAAAPPPPLGLRDATLADSDALGALYADAFDDNPAFDSIFQLRRTDAGAHTAALRWLLTARAWMLLRARCPYLVAWPPGDATPLAAAALVPNGRKPGAAAFVRAGVLTWPFRYGLASLRRALALDGDIPEAPAADGATLMHVAVRPGSQGRGAGSALVRELLARWDAAGGGGVSVNTQRAINLPFYARFGFVVVAERRMEPSGADAYTSWDLRREAAAARAS